MPKLRTQAPILLAVIVGPGAGVSVSDIIRSSSVQADEAKPAHAPQVPGGKAPIQEMLHCPLAFAGVHLLKDVPEYSKVAYHFCKPVNEDLNQCVLYDGTGPDAKLIGVEYLVSDAVYQKMPAEEKGVLARPQVRGRCWLPQEPDANGR